MGKAALLIVAVVSLMGSTYALNANQGRQQTTERVTQHGLEVVARSAALAGYHRAKQALADDFTSTSFQGTYDDASYTVTVTVAGTSADVVTTGSVTAPSGQPVSYTVKALYEQDASGGLPEEVPPFMQHMLASDGNLELRGNYGISVFSGAPSDANANVHTNGNIEISGRAGSVAGFGYYVGSTSGHVGSTFNPNHNPDDLPVTQQVSELDIPVLDIAAQASTLSVDQTTESDVTLSGVIVGGTREDPLIWHIKGNVTASGNALLTGYVMLLVEGNVSISGNFQGGMTGYLGGDESNIAIYTSGNVSLGGTADIYGQFFANGNIEMHGTPSIIGSLTTDGNFIMNGTPDLYFRNASPALTTNWQGPAGTPQTAMTAYSEWPGSVN